MPDLKSATGIRTTHSITKDSREAVRAFHAGVRQENMALVLFFCSSRHDLAVVQDELRCLFGDTLVVGCTTAGEIGPAGYLSRSLSGLSFSREACTAAVGYLDNLSCFSTEAGAAFGAGTLRRLESIAPQADAGNTFAIQLIDGLSVREESVTRVVQDALGGIAMMGGSAGDDLDFERTWIYHDGAFSTDSALLLLVTVTQPFRIFNTQHFQKLAERVVVTAADPRWRRVMELNGLPAVEEYARLVGATVNTLDPGQFAASPVVVMIDGQEYVRSIQKCNPDGSLTFYSAIEEGMVLRAARGKDLVADLDRAFAGIRREVGPPAVVLACDCILRNLEIQREGLTPAVDSIFRAHNTVGFSTYGEQFNGVHVNQTFTAIAIGGGTPDV